MVRCTIAVQEPCAVQQTECKEDPPGGRALALLVLTYKTMMFQNKLLDQTCKTDRTDGAISSKGVVIVP